MSRPTRTERRRAQLALRFASLEAMESKSLITESLGILTMGIGVPTALAMARPAEASQAVAAKPRSSVMDQTITPIVIVPAAAKATVGGGAAPAIQATPDLNPAPAASAPTMAVPAANPISVKWASPVAPPKGGGAGGSSHGGSGAVSAPAASGATGVAAPSNSSSSSSPGGSSSTAPILPASTGATSTTSSGSSSTSAGSTGISGIGGTKTSSTNPFGHAGLAEDQGITNLFGPHAPVLPPPPVDTNSSGASLGTFPYFPLYTLDENEGNVLFPGVAQARLHGGSEDLIAQVSGTTVSSYSWDTSNLYYATGITGTSTSQLQFSWQSSYPSTLGPEPSSTVTLTVTDTNGHVEIQTYIFQLDLMASGSTPTWSQAIAPGSSLPGGPTFDSQNASVDANTGALETSIALPTYNPNVPGVVLDYNSVAANPLPIIVEHHTIDPTLAIPSEVSAQLTFNGTAGSTYYYNTSQFIPGDVQQIALQAGSAVSTGRYGYSLAIGDIRSSTTTTTVTGTATIINDSGSAVGAGWTLNGLESIIPASGGVILDLGGGQSLWFATGSGSTYVDPAGDFSTLVANIGGTYTRTLTDGSKIQFNSSGQEIADVDTNGVAISYAYDGSGRLSTIQDHYGNTTTFTYDGTTGLLDEITDPSGRIATFTHSSSNLSGVTLPDSSTWGYSYGSSGQMTQVTDPRSNSSTIVYDAADRVGTITRPDTTSDTFSADQEAGFVPSGSGTSGSPAAATLLAQAYGSHTDPLGQTTDIRPDWLGLGLTSEATDPSGNVSVNDLNANGLATVATDRVNAITAYSYDSLGNPTTITYSDYNTDQYTYNSFSEPTVHIDGNGNATTYTYDAYGNNTVIKDALNNLTTMTYTATGQLATMKDANLHTTSYAYDSQDRLTTLTNADSSTVLYGYNSESDKTSTTDGRGYVTTMSYDPMNRETGMTDALGDKATFVYDAAGNKTVDEEPLSRTTSYAYDVMDRLTTMTDPLSHVTVYGYNADGDRTTVTDPLSRITTIAYDPENRPTVVTDPLGKVTTTAYDGEGEVIQVTDPLSRITTTTYTDRKKVATVTDPLGNITTYSYTPTNKPSTISLPGSSGGTGVLINPQVDAYAYDADDREISFTDALGEVTTTVYDAVGNKTATIDPNNHATSYAYDSRNRMTTMTDAAGDVTVTGYDADSDKTTVKDPLGNITTTAYDALDRVATITQAVGGSTTYAYDAAGRQVGLTDPVGNRTTWAYDAADRLTTLTTPIGTATYTYDSANQETATTDADGRQTTYSYDAAGNKTGETWVAASPSEILTYTYDADHEMTGVIDRYATLTFSYDGDGRQLTAATSSTAGQPSVTLASTYDAQGQVTSLTDNLSSAGVISYAYDAQERLTTITSSYGGTAASQILFDYDPAGRVTDEARTIVGSGTDVTTSFTYDAADRVVTITNQVAGGSSLDGQSYVYNAASDLTSETNAEGTLSYTYDADNELTGVTGASTATYTYDNNGNRTMTGYTTGTDNETTAGAGYTYTYDADGNLASKTQTSSGDVWTYTWDYRNRLTGVVEENSSHAVLLQGTYTYDAMDRRIGVDETVSGTETKLFTVYNGVNPYADFNGSGTLLTRYIYGPAADQILARISASGTSAWYLTDHLGSVRDIVNTSGTVIDHLGYDAYGNVTTESSPSNGDQFKFDGMVWDAAIGLYYDNARYYNSEMGSFINVDPIGFKATDTNLYRFVENTPIAETDLTGLSGTIIPRKNWPKGVKKLEGGWIKGPDGTEYPVDEIDMLHDDDPHVAEGKVWPRHFDLHYWSDGEEEVMRGTINENGDWETLDPDTLPDAPKVADPVPPPVMSPAPAPLPNPAIPPVVMPNIPPTGVPGLPPPQTVQPPASTTSPSPDPGLILKLLDLIFLKPARALSPWNWIPPYIGPTQPGDPPVGA